MKILILLITLLITTMGFAGVQFYKVGSDNNCDFSTIQAAIDAGLSNEIRIATNGSPYFEHLVIDDVDMTLRGGYADCAAAQINITDLSHPVIDGSNTGNVIAIKGNNNSNSIELKNLYIGNGDFGIAMNFGATVDLLLDDVLNFNNNKTGIQMYLGMATVIVKDSQITTNGDGGIDCIGNNNTLALTGTTKIDNNTTNIYGGGLNLRDGCSTSIFSPVEISNNIASIRGGGIYIGGGSELLVYGIFFGCQNGICFGINDQPVTIKNNNAGVGGGIYAIGENTDVSLFNIVMDNNTATFSAGAINLSDMARLNSTAIPFANNPVAKCWNNNKKCNQFINNKSPRGGVFEVTGAANMNISSSWIQNNRADRGVVASVFTDGELTINNSMMVENGNNGDGSYSDNELLSVTGDINSQLSAIILEFVTIADNRVTQEIIENAEAAVTLHSSIVAETMPINNSFGATTEQFECLIVNENTSFSAGATVVIDNPDFINPNNDDYHIKPTSPAVDYCYEITNSNDVDFDLEQHGFDDPNKFNLHGTFDIGADEYVVDNDVIFVNSFEEL